MKQHYKNTIALLFYCILFALPSALVAQQQKNNQKPSKGEIQESAKPLATSTMNNVAWKSYNLFGESPFIAKNESLKPALENLNYHIVNNESSSRSATKTDSIVFMQLIQVYRLALESESRKSTLSDEVKVAIAQELIRVNQIAASK